MTLYSTPPLPIKPFPWWLYLIALLLVAVLVVWPLASVIFAHSVADANGCRIQEGEALHCIVGGEDWSQLLYTMNTMGWFILATIPVGGIALIIWFIVLAIHLHLRSRKLYPAR